MGDSIRIRPATRADVPGLLAIYRTFVQASVVSFETATPSVKEFSERIRIALAGWQWLVAEKDGQCIGYAYGPSHRERSTYCWSVEVSAYIQRNHHRHIMDHHVA
jgi:L-amino acid N-acyltransferase YncA